MSARRQPYFLPYQRRWILDPAPMKLYEKSRRIGITYATSFRAVRKCMTRRNFTQWVSSRDLLTAREFIQDYVVRWVRALNLLAGPTAVVDERHGVSAWTVRFAATGSRIVSLSSTPQAFAGKGGDVLLDEVDLHPDPETLIDMALPCTTWGGQLEAVSAYDPSGSRNSPFARLVEQARAANPMGWSLHATSIEDAVAEGFVDRLNAVTGSRLSDAEFLARMRGRCRGEAAWQSQYLCRPADDGGHLLPYELIVACEDRVEAPAARPRGPRWLGVDIGRHHDLTVFWLLEDLGDVAWTRVLKTLRACPFHVQLEALLELLGTPGLRRCCIDAGGLGAMLAEEAARRARVPVEPVVFTPAIKEDLAMSLLRRFQARTVRIPADPEVRDDLHAVRKQVTSAGHLRYAADRHADHHADRFWALALAVHAAGDKTPEAPGAVPLGEEPSSALERERRGNLRSLRGSEW